MLCLCQCVYVLCVYPSENQCLHWVDEETALQGLVLWIDLGLILELGLSLIVIRISKVFSRLTQLLTDNNIDTKLWMCPQTERMLTLVFCANTYIYTIFKDRRTVAFSKKDRQRSQYVGARARYPGDYWPDCHGIWYRYYLWFPRGWPQRI